MSNCMSRAMPSVQKLKFGSEITCDPRNYREVVVLCYDMYQTRPTWVVSRLSQFLSSPLE